MYNEIAVQRARTRQSVRVCNEAIETTNKALNDMISYVQMLSPDSTANENFSAITTPFEEVKASESPHHEDQQRAEKEEEPEPK